MGKKLNLDITENSFWDAMDFRLKGIPDVVIFMFTKYTTPYPVIRIGRKLSSISDNKLMTISVSDNPEILRDDNSRINKYMIPKVFQYIADNKEDILRFWNGDLSAFKFLDIMEEKELV